MRARRHQPGLLLALATAACAVPGPEEPATPTTAPAPPEVIGPTSASAESVAAPTPAPAPMSLSATWPPADVLLIGEQHDAVEHQRHATRVVEHLATRGRLLAVAMEMVEQGRGTASLRRDADESQMRAALAWDERGWPWAAYGTIVVAAVRAGVPVIGANLPRDSLRRTMADERLDAEVSDALRAQLLADVRDGHCGLLPPTHLPAMTRVQIGRDLAMARTLASVAQPGGVVMLVAGANHVDRRRGVPQHLPALRPGVRLHALGLSAGPAGLNAAGFDEVWVTPALQRPDPCEGLAERFAPTR